MIHRWLLTLQSTALPDHISQRTGKNTPHNPWAWCEVILITPRSWLFPSWCCRNWPILDRIRPGISPMTELLVTLLSQHSVQPEFYHLDWGNSINFMWILTVHSPFPIQWSLPAFEPISSFSWTEMHGSICCVFSRSISYLHDDVVVQLAKQLFSSQFIRNMQTN